MLADKVLLQALNKIKMRMKHIQINRKNNVNAIGFEWKRVRMSLKICGLIKQIRNIKWHSHTRWCLLSRCCQHWAALTFLLTHQYTVFENWIIQAGFEITPNNKQTNNASRNWLKKVNTENIKISKLLLVQLSSSSECTHYDSVLITHLNYF